MKFAQLLIMVIALNLIFQIGVPAMNGVQEGTVLDEIQNNLGNFIETDSDIDSAQERMERMRGNDEDPSGETEIFKQGEATGGIDFLDSILNLIVIAQLFFTLTIGGILQTPNILGYITGLPTAIQIFILPMLLIWIILNLLLVLKFYEVLKTGRG